MKKLPIFISLLFISFNISAQKIYPNGYIYSESTMNKLTDIVDSLNLKYETSNFDQTFYSKEQMIGHFIKLNTGDIKAVRRDMESQISFKDFVKKYPDASINKNILIVKSIEKNYYSGEEFLSFIEFGKRQGYRITKQDESIRLQKEFKDSWLYDYFEGGNYMGEAISAFYFPDNFKSQIIPQKYARMIGYADCLIDTTGRGKPKKPIHFHGPMRYNRIINAALNAAENNWKFFVQTHMRLVTHRGPFVRGGEYDKDGRGTYISELEAMNIDVGDLFFGTSLRIKNPTLYGLNTPRFVWVLSDLKNKADIEQAMLNMITDDELDDYNRAFMYYLFEKYCQLMPDKNVEKIARKKMDMAAKKLPKYLYKQIENAEN